MWLYLETETIRNFLFDHYVLSDSLWPHGLQYAVPGFLVLHYLPEFAQTLVIGSLWSHPLSPPSPALNLPSIRVFTSGGQSLGLQHQSFMNVQDWFPLGLTSLISWQSKRLSKVFSSTIIQKNQFVGTQSSLWLNTHICTWLLEKP